MHRHSNEASIVPLTQHEAEQERSNDSERQQVMPDLTALAAPADMLQTKDEPLQSQQKSSKAGPEPLISGKPCPDSIAMPGLNVLAKGMAGDNAQRPCSATSEMPKVHQGKGSFVQQSSQAIVAVTDQPPSLMTDPCSQQLESSTNGRQPHLDINASSIARSESSLAEDVLLESSATRDATSKSSLSSQRPRPRHLQHILQAASQPSPSSPPTTPTGNLIKALETHLVAASSPLDGKAVPQPAADPMLASTSPVPSGPLAETGDDMHALCLSCESAPRQTLFAPCGHIVLCGCAAPLIPHAVCSYLMRLYLWAW